MGASLPDEKSNFKNANSEILPNTKKPRVGAQVPNVKGEEDMNKNDELIFAETKKWGTSVFFEFIFLFNFLWWKVYKLRKRGAAAAKASLAQLEEQEGSYAKDQYAHESLEPAQGTAS